MYLKYYLLIILAMSLLAYVLYFVDKKKAEHNHWRIKEHTLLSIGIIFGALGSLFAMYTIRHKNRKWYFVFINVTSLIVHIAIGIYIAIN